MAIDENRTVTQDDQPVTIRAARPTDSQAVLRLAAALVPDGEGVDSRRALKTLLALPDHRVWVAELASTGNPAMARGAVVGWMHAFIARRVGTVPFVEVGGLVVESARRRGGIGSSLLARATTWGDSLGMPVRVRCREEREDSHVFYLAEGFRHIKNQRVFEWPR